MSQRTFPFRLRNSHVAPRPRQRLAGGGVPGGIRQMTAPEPQPHPPSFQLYLLSLLLCQHHYLVANAEAVVYIKKCIKLCQVSQNLPHSVQKCIRLSLAD